MSDTFDDVAEDSLNEFEEADLSDGAEDIDVDETSVEEDLPFLDIDQFRDHVVTVKVNGEELKVPLAEAVAGFQRQADYTRKTQELAQQKADLQWATAIRGALENDPQGTLELLANHFGVQQRQAAAPEPFAQDFTQPWSDPADPKVRDIEARLARFEEAQAAQRLEQTIRQLSDKYGDEFDPNEVVSAALATGSTDLEATFKQIKFDKVMEEARQAKAAAAKAAQRTAAKRQAAVVSGGSSAGAGKVESGSIRSIADAWNEAKRELSA